MAETPGAIGRRYLPFLAVAAVQLLLVAIAPSKGVTTVNPYAAAGTTGTGAGLGSGAAGGGGGAGGSGGGSGGAAGSTAGPGGGGAQGTGVSGPGVTSATGQTLTTDGGPQDRTDCAADGQQLGPPGYTQMPPCVPVWHGTGNGGSTMPGVTATSINYVWYAAQANAAVNSILSTQGLAATSEQSCEAIQAFGQVVNKYWTLYGRKFVPLDGPGSNSGSAQQSPCKAPYFQSQCPLTPPDPACSTADAKVVASMHPAFVLAGVADTSFYTELAHLHVVVVGGIEAPESYYDAYAPYFYGLLMDGTRQATFDAQFWCNSLNNQPAIYAGQDVQTGRHWAPSIPTRKLAIVFPETNGDEVNKINVDYMKRLITGGECNTPGGVLELPYQSDIGTAEQQAGNIVQALINNHVTTVACWCDLIAPVFWTNTAQLQGYFPEWFLLGVGLIDYDQVARLYNPSEWNHTFGVSDLALAQQFAQSDAVKWWQSVGNPGEPDTQTNAVFPFFALMANAFQAAGPEPNPLLLHQGLEALPVTNVYAVTHDPTRIQTGFKPPSPWTAAEDVRLAYWNGNRVSEVDGKQGSYCPVNGGQRFQLGALPTGLPDMFDKARNGC